MRHGTHQLINTAAGQVIDRLLGPPPRSRRTVQTDTAAYYFGRKFNMPEQDTPDFSRLPEPDDTERAALQAEAEALAMIGKRPSITDAMAAAAANETGTRPDIPAAVPYEVRLNDGDTEMIPDCAGVDIMGPLIVFFNTDRIIITMINSESIFRITPQFGGDNA